MPHALCVLVLHAVHDETDFIRSAHGDTSVPVEGNHSDRTAPCSQRLTEQLVPRRDDAVTQPDHSSVHPCLHVRVRDSYRGRETFGDGVFIPCHTDLRRHACDVAERSRRVSERPPVVPLWNNLQCFDDDDLWENSVDKD